MMLYEVKELNPVTFGRARFCIIPPSGSNTYFEIDALVVERLKISNELVQLLREKTEDFILKNNEIKITIK